MSKKIVIEDEVNFLVEPTAEFVSLVDRGAIQEGFKIVKSEKGRNNMSKKVYQVLVPDNVDEETLKNLAEEHSFSIKEKADSDLEGYNVFSQAKEDEVNLENKSLVKMADNVYGIVADPADEADENVLEKEELDYMTMDSLAEGAFAAVDIILGTLRQPEADNMSRKEVIVSALDNYKKHVEAVFSTLKSDDVLEMENLELKGENLEELAYQVVEDPDTELEKEELTEEIQAQFEDAQKQLAESLDKFKENVFAKMDEKISATSENFNKSFEEMKSSLNDELAEKLKLLTEKEEFEAKIKEVSEAVEEVKNTTKQRKSEIEEFEEPKTSVRRESDTDKFRFKTLA